MTLKVSMKVNGKPVSADVEARTLLVTYIRENLRLTGTHVGCDTAQCGACTVLMNGKAIKSCSIVAMQAEGADIMTIEGVAKPDGTLHPMQGEEPPRPERAGSPRGAGRQPLPLHRLSQHREKHHGRRESHERENLNFREAHHERPSYRRARPAQGRLPLSHRRWPVHRRRADAEPGPRGLREIAACTRVFEKNIC